MQIAVMQADVAELVANGQPLTLFGDSLFLALDLSTPNLPAGSRVRVGGAVLEVTPVPHNGCRKFQGRFGQDALRLVSMKELRHRNLRGIYMRVVEPGEAGPGDAVEVDGPARGDGSTVGPARRLVRLVDEAHHASAVVNGDRRRQTAPPVIQRVT